MLNNVEDRSPSSSAMKHVVLSADELNLLRDVLALVIKLFAEHDRLKVMLAQEILKKLDD